MSQVQKGVKAEELTRPIRRKLRIRSTWPEWKDRWRATDDPDYLHTLLFNGFDQGIVQQTDSDEQHFFYLSAAEGYLSVRFDHVQGEGEMSGVISSTIFGHVRYYGEVREKLARKAFQVFCNKVLRDTHDPKQNSKPSWVYLLEKPAILAAILHFFRLEPDQDWPRFVNLDYNLDPPTPARDPETQTAVDFLWGFANLAFLGRMPKGYRTRYGNDVFYDEWRLAVPFQSRLVPILNGLGRINLLSHSRAKIGWGAFIALEEVAMRELVKMPWQPDHGHTNRPRNLVEAVVGGSAAAQVLDLRLRANQLKRQVMKSERLQQKAEEAQEAARMALMAAQMRMANG
jgi:hypothetical protein